MASGRHARCLAIHFSRTSFDNGHHSTKINANKRMENHRTRCLQRIFSDDYLDCSIFNDKHVGFKIQKRIVVIIRSFIIKIFIQDFYMRTEINRILLSQYMYIQVSKDYKRLPKKLFAIYYWSLYLMHFLKSFILYKMYILQVTAK